MKKHVIRLSVLSVFLTYALPAFAQEHTEHAEQGGAALPQLDIALYPNVLFWMISSFILFFLIMRFVGVPGVQDTVVKRRRVLESDLESARKASDEAARVVKSYEEGLQEARRHAQETVGGIVAAAAQETAIKREKQETDLKHRMVVAQENLAEAKNAAMKDTQQFVSGLVDEIVTKVLQTGIDAPASAARK